MRETHDINKAVTQALPLHTTVGELIAAIQDLCDDDEMVVAVAESLLHTAGRRARRERAA